MSTDLTAMTAAELMTEMRTAQSISQCFGEKQGDWADQWHEKYAAITAELDARCEKAEISIINRAGMNQFKYGAYIGGTNGVWLGIPAVEQHALEGYLLSKEVKP